MGRFSHAYFCRSQRSAEAKGSDRLEWESPDGTEVLPHGVAGR